MRLAHFDGSFTHSSELQELTGIEEQAMLAWAKTTWDKPVSSEVLVTALVVACLQLNFAMEQTTWVLLAKKATEWLQVMELHWTSPRIHGVDSLIAAASTTMSQMVLKKDIDDVATPMTKWMSLASKMQVPRTVV